jgi:hypothetical protein
MATNSQFYRYRYAAILRLVALLYVKAQFDLLIMPAASYVENDYAKDQRP